MEKKPKVAIIDYGAGNVRSLGNMLTFLDIPYEITSDKTKIQNADRIIFPGQGHFAQAMEKLNSNDMISFVQDVVSDGKTFLGVCLGLQVLFETSEEAPNIQGLGIFKGNVKKFEIGKTPQIGWNKIKTTENNSYLDDDYFYFVNSYCVCPENKDIISSYANYHIDFCASVEYKNITAVQFHPEKSSNAGIEFFRKWIRK
ncbi:MAG: imidazole glycerol phosphate synthase subunit HisH [Candidatus Gastranaerophilales bacterium]|nr:imidazole glycerol phosphate synthase subunit HisH [Candidatus Gastranaerophilales bacterium]